MSDDSYWKDFPQIVPGTSPRLLGQDLQLQRELPTALGPLQAYARVQHWQVLQTGTGTDLIVAPYQRSPQLGLRLAPVLPAGLRAAIETEVNHFTRTSGTADPTAPTGWRWHALGQISRPFSWPGAWLTPRLTLNAASYSFDSPGQARQRQSRVIPTTSVDAGMVFERDSAWFGRAQRQTLEPRLLYVNTPFRDQAGLPNFDAAERDFNAVSIYAENAFSGIDRVSDAHQITAGVTTRLVDATTGAETLRLGLAQRIRLRDQRVVLSGDVLTQRFSDVLVEGGTSVFNPWNLDAALQYNPDSQRVVRSILGVRFQPGPFRTLSAGYRLARGLSEQVELGWQWPLWRGKATPVGAAGGCGGTLYAVGRLNYSLRDSRMTDSLIGAEYDRQASYRTATSYAYLQACSAKATIMFPFLSKLRILRSWAGVCDVSTDFSPIIGHTGVDGFMLSTGWGTWGFKAIPAAGEQLAALIATGTPSPLIAPFGLDRFANELAMADPSSAGTR